MRTISYCFLLFALAGTHTIFAQGKLMLVGGGAEDDGGWSDQPYAWFVEQAANKKIGIISYSDADEWLPNYFRQLGATSADNIKIDAREMAQEAQMFDSLTQYDALFFKGGDQLKYYNFYKDTPVQQAIEYIYNQGGVIGGTSAGMAILSGVLFTASEGSAYPIDALENINSSYITLADDFLSFYPNYIFDTHFIERGRTARLIGFMANWFAKSETLINGLGVDDRTAFCINSSGSGTVYGTGAISIYKATHFEISNNQLNTSDLKAVQLTHGQTYDLSKESVLDRDLSTTSTPTFTNTYYQVFGSGVKSLSSNEKLLKWAIDHKKLSGDILIVSKGQDVLAQAYQSYLESVQSETVNVVVAEAASNHVDSAAVRNLIKSSAIVLVLADQGLQDFIDGGPTGALLYEHFQRNQMTSVFIGGIVNQLGPTYCVNIYSDPLNAYKNKLQFENGLNLLPDTYIIAKAFELDDKDYYENISSSAVDAVLNQALSTGIMLTDDAYFGYYINGQDELMMSTLGSLSSVVIMNYGTDYQQTEQLTSSNQPRLQYAFDSLAYKLIKDTPIVMGEVSPIEEQDYVFEEEIILSLKNGINHGYIQLMQNPVQDKVSFKFLKPIALSAEIYAQNGQLLLNHKFDNSSPDIPVEELPNGMYQVVLKTADNQLFYLLKFIKRK